LAHRARIVRRLFVDDIDNPYETEAGKPFNLIRARGLGGRMAIPVHGRQCLHYGARDFRALDALAPPWPLAPEELDPYYELVEKRLGLSGGLEYSPCPDSVLAHIRAPNIAETATIAKIKARWPGLTPMLGRYGPPVPALDQAALTGRLRCRIGAGATHIALNENGRANAVNFYDIATRTRRRATASLILLAASTLELPHILLASRNDRTPDGIGRGSGALGRFLMDHVSIKAEGIGGAIETGDSAADVGRCVYVPRFESRNLGHVGEGRGFGMRIYGSPGVPGLLTPRGCCGRKIRSCSASSSRPGACRCCALLRHSPSERALAVD
jgi:choline dehydrogenase-like flavoprotein